MAILAAFTPAAMTSAQYDEIIRRLDAAGAGAPDGRLQHFAFGPEGHLRVVDVWESPEKLTAFSGTLMPILAAIGVNPGQPEISQIHNHIAR